MFPEAELRAPGTFPAVFCFRLLKEAAGKFPQPIFCACGFGCETAVLLILILSCYRSIAEKQRDAPQSCQGHNRIHDSASPGVLPAENGGYQVVLENADGTPVDAADNCQQQCKFIQHLNPSFLNRE